MPSTQDQLAPIPAPLASGIRPKTAHEQFIDLNPEITYCDYCKGKHHFGKLTVELIDFGGKFVYTFDCCCGNAYSYMIDRMNLVFAGTPSTDGLGYALEDLIWSSERRQIRNPPKTPVPDYLTPETVPFCNCGSRYQFQNTVVEVTIDPSSGARKLICFQFNCPECHASMELRARSDMMSQDEIEAQQFPLDALQRVEIVPSRFPSPPTTSDFSELMNEIPDDEN